MSMKIDKYSLIELVIQRGIFFKTKIKIYLFIKRQLAQAVSQLNSQTYCAQRIIILLCSFFDLLCLSSFAP